MAKEQVDMDLPDNWTVVLDKRYVVTDALTGETTPVTAVGLKVYDGDMVYGDGMWLDGHDAPAHKIAEAAEHLVQEMRKRLEKREVQ